MRAVLAIACALALAGCESAINMGGVADYDALRKTQQECAAQGGQLVLKAGGNAEYIDDYACKRK